MTEHETLLFEFRQYSILVNLINIRIEKMLEDRKMFEDKMNAIKTRVNEIEENS